MSISCGCGDVEDAEWYWQTDYPLEYQTLTTKRGSEGFVGDTTSGLTEGYTAIFLYQRTRRQAKA